jgi:hypothetical protein
MLHASPFLRKLHRINGISFPHVDPLRKDKIMFIVCC